jgi:TP901 family phage tail tape measure protein
MARTSATISVGADTRQLERDIQSALARDFKFKGLNEKAFTQPLGRITGAANEFQKSLDASNARVIAFGASAGLIYTVEKAFTSLIKSTIDVQKSLTDINVILNVSTRTLSQFGSDLFSIAKNTGQSFDVVAQAATELSRQGLGLEETLKRTRDALILTRLSGLDTVSAVEALTATINSFNKAGLDSTVIINKLANVDAAFAVSSADLAEAIKRVGSSAADAGVDFDQLLAIVTSVQQTTARGGAVIGNSLKTIFTRIQRTDTLDQLEQLGIKVRTLEGDTLPAIQILSNLSNTFNQLGDAQRAQVAETVGGVFQINILKAALSDLQKEYSTYNNALKTASSATNEAIVRNEALNQTLSSLINKTFVNLTKVGSDIGKISFGPTIENLLNLLNKGLESIDIDGEGIGSKIGKGILEGIGSFISGPGVILLTAVITKLVFNLGKFAAQSLQTVLNLNTKSEERAAIQAKINQVLAQETSLVQAVYNKEISVLDVETKILNIIRQQTIERERAAALSSTLTGGLIGKGVSAKGGTLKAKSAGFIPNFASSEILGALAGGYSPGYVRKMNIPGEGSITYNSAEKVKKFPGMSQPAIMPPMGSNAGKNYQSQFNSVYGFNPYASNGFIPNFAAGPAGIIRSAGIKSLEDAEKYLVPGKKTYDINGQKVSQAQLQGVLNRTPRGQAAGVKPLDVSNIASVLLPFIGSSRRLTGPFSPKGKSSEFAITNIPVYGMKKDALEGDLADDKRRLFTNITNSILDNTSGFIDTLKPLGRTVNKGTLANAFSSSGEKGAYGAVRGAVGSAFEVGVKTALNYTALDSQKGFGDFDVRGGKNLRNLQKLFGFSTILGDFKGSLSNDNLQSFAGKIYKEVGMTQFGRFSTAKGKKASGGFIPNFTALNDAIGREAGAGTPMSRIRIGKDSRLTSSANPLGLGVYNTKDEPMGLSQGVSRYGSNKAKTAGASKGFIPNFILPILAAGAAEAGGATAVRFIIQQVLSAALFIAIDRLGSKIQDSIKDEKTRAGVGAVVQGAGYAGSALLSGGGKKVAGGAFLTGVLLNLVNSLNGLDDTTKEAIATSEDNKDKLDAFSSAVVSYNQVIERLKDETITNAEREKILTDSNESLATILSSTPTELQKNLKDAISSGNFDKVSEELGKVQIALQTQVANSTNLANVLQLTADKSLKGDELQKFTNAIIALRTGKGTSVGAEVVKNPELIKNFVAGLNAPLGPMEITKADITKTVKDLYGYNEFGYNPKQKGSNQKISPEQLAELRVKAFPKVVEAKKQELEQKRLQALSGNFGNLLRGAGVDENVIGKVIAELNNIPFSELSQQAEFVNKTLENLGIDVKGTGETMKAVTKYLKADILRRAEQAGDVSSSSEALKRFKDNLSPEALEAYGKEVLDANKDLNANRQATAKVLDLQEGLRKSILNETEEKKVEAKYTKQVSKALEEAGGDLDKFTIGLEGAQERLVSRSNRERGLVFADQYRADQQAGREKQILGGKKSIGDIGSAFFDEFDNRAEDSFREAQLGAADTARTIKSEFNNAFLSFANGTATASDAFTKMALNISDKVQQLALEFSTNLAFGKLFGSTSNIFGGGGGGGGIGDFFGSLFKSKGGLIKGYSTGGHVLGGSGNKDDIPAMLSGGEYVIRKNAVKKYGPEYLQMLNEGKVERKEGGGPMSIIAGAIGKSMSQSISQALATTPGSSSGLQSMSPAVGISINKNKNKHDNYFKYGGRVQRFATGGESSYLGENVYRYNDPMYPTAGKNIIDPGLSLQAILDPNNPQNRIRQEREQTLFSYLQYVEGVNESNRQGLEDNIRMNKEIQDQYNSQQSAKSKGAWYQALFGLGSAGLGFLAKGGEVRRFASGGSSKDDIPALLMGGEFVMRKQAVNMYGKKFFDDLNSGRAKKFADGGQVGSIGEVSSTNYSPTNNVSVVVNLNQEKVQSEKTDATGDTSVQAEATRTRKIAEQVKTQVLRVITEQQRPGGMLSSAVYQKRS